MRQRKVSVTGLEGAWRCIPGRSGRLPGASGERVEGKEMAKPLHTRVDSDSDSDSDTDGYVDSDTDSYYCARRRNVDSVGSPKRNHHRGRQTPQREVSHPHQSVPRCVKHLELLLEQCEALSPWQCRDCVESERCQRWWDWRVLRGAGLEGVSESELEKLVAEFLSFSRLGRKESE